MKSTHHTAFNNMDNRREIYYSLMMGVFDPSIALGVRQLISYIPSLLVGWYLGQ